MLVPIVAEHLVYEKQHVLSPPKLQRYLDCTKASRALTELRRLAEWHGDPVEPPRICRDPDDDYPLALALAAKADALVTGDEDLHAVQNPGVEVITPRELLDRIPS